jgi:nucleoside-diphosphate-sugar epimerase
MDLTIYGHGGFIGKHYVSRYQAKDHMWLPPRWSRRPDPYKKTDILYLISTTHNYHVFDDPTLDVKTNLVVLTETLDSWLRNNPQGTFNFVSSWFVYGERQPALGEVGKVPESDMCRPKGFYSITKRCAELLVESFCTTHNLSYRILRLCNIIGPGDMGVSKQKNALQYLINEMKHDRPIEIYGTGEFTRTYMDVEDCVAALRLVMDKGEENTVYNIGTEPSQKFIDLIKLAHQLLGSKSEIRYIKPKKFHQQVQVENFDMDCSKLRSLGFEPKHNIVGTVSRLCK